MDRRTSQTLFALLRSAVCGTKLTEKEKNHYAPELLGELLKTGAEHDVAHLLVFGLKKNDLISEADRDLEKHILRAVYRYERMQYEYGNLCDALERAQIPFLPLKGVVIRRYYPEPWMRTSCDIDVLVHGEDLGRAVSCLTENLQYTEKLRSTHDISLYSPTGVHVELHFDLVEEGRANNAIRLLHTVWDNVSLHENKQYWYEMSDAFFYFYHIAHMAKHFENGGCGIRPFIDLHVLACTEDAKQTARDELLAKGDLLRFAENARALSEVWFGDGEPDALSAQMQDFLLSGGAYGSSDNRVALQQKKKGGRLGYLFSRIFAPYTRLKRYYPVLEKYPWLMPVMQVRRWLMLLRPEVARMAKTEILTNKVLNKSRADEMSDFLDRIGL